MEVRIISWCSFIFVIGSGDGNNWVQLAALELNDPYAYRTALEVREVFMALPWPAQNHLLKLCQPFELREKSQQVDVTMATWRGRQFRMLEAEEKRKG